MPGVSHLSFDGVWKVDTAEQCQFIALPLVARCSIRKCLGCRLTSHRPGPGLRPFGGGRGANKGGRGDGEWREQVEEGVA